MIKRLFLIVIAAAIATGCASARKGIGDNVTVSKVVSIIPGKTTRAEVQTVFGKPDIVKEVGKGAVEYTYVQGKNDSVSWLVLSGYLVYHPTRAFSGSRLLVIRFEGETVARFVASDGKLTLKEGFEEEAKRKE